MKFYKWELTLLTFSLTGLLFFTFGLNIMTFLKSIGIEKVFWVIAALPFVRRLIIRCRKNIDKFKKLDVNQLS